MPQTQFELRRKLLQLEALYDVGRALNTLRPESELLEELMHRAVAVLDAMIGIVFSLDEKLNVQQLFTLGVEAPLPPGSVLNDPAIRRVLASRDPLSMQRVIDLVARVAASQANVLIRGESGTGKEMVARLIHGNSPRKDKPFVAINCAALPETLLESELFGIERGVATGVEARAGKFELARGGTVFLDEVGDIPLALQAKLLRVLQEREIEKLGGRRRIPVDVRILSATHRNLEEMIERSEFRQDLYYRLKVVEIVLPPLRERKEDIPKLVRFFLDKYGKREGLRDVRITQDALQKLMRYQFAGNVRELENLIEGALALTTDPVIDSGDLLLPISVSATAGEELSADLPKLNELQRRYIARVLAFTGGNMSKAAKILGIDRKTLYRMRAAMSQNTTSGENWDVH